MVKADIAAGEGAMEDGGGRENSVLVVFRPRRDNGLSKIKNQRKEKRKRIQEKNSRKDERNEGEEEERP